MRSLHALFACSVGGKAKKSAASMPRTMQQTTRREAVALAVGFGYESDGGE